MRKIGGNLNQIARKANIEQKVSSEELEDVKGYIRQLETAITEHVRNPKAEK